MKKFLEQKPIIILGEIIIILALLVLIGYTIKSWINSGKEEDDVEGAAELGNETAVTDDKLSKYVKNVPASQRAKVLEGIKAMRLAELGNMIEDAKGVTDDDEEMIYTAFKMIKSKIQLAVFADYFKSVYKTPIFVYLQNFLNAEELNKINDIVSKLKPY